MALFNTIHTRMIKRTKHLTALGAISAALIASPSLADVKTGVDAWSSGDYVRAVAEWQEPAAQGDADALFNLAQAYRLGRGVTSDLARARQLYAQAAEKGHVQAADNYGLLLFQQGDQNKAMPLINAAADRGDPRAQYVMALAHFNADYAPKDWVRAYALMTLSNAAGLPQASGALRQMDQYVPLAQRQQAQSLARQIETAASQKRSTELAAVDLGTPAPSVPPSVAPTRTQAPAPQPAVASRPAAPAPSPAAARPAAPRASGPWRVQLGAFGVASNANKLWNRLSGKAPLAGTQKKLVRAGNVTKLLAVGFASRKAAQTACNALKRQGQGCYVAGNR